MDHRQCRRTHHDHGDVPPARLLWGAAGGDGRRQAPQQHRQREALVGDRGVEVQPRGIERVNDRTYRCPASRSANRPYELVDGQDGQDMCQDDDGKRGRPQRRSRQLGECADRLVEAGEMRNDARAVSDFAVQVCLDGLPHVDKLVHPQGSGGDAQHSAHSEQAYPR